ncbi:MAG: dihydroorotate dehydrogenase [Magnetococcales bacterium]|nr:dihydroorotate dehydrogenase [Magnetococcales bacterium]
MDEPSLSVDFAGIPLRTPVVLLSGCVGFGEELLNLDGFDAEAIGAICLKGTTLTPRRGNPPHRLAETPGGMLNAIGLQNPGARQVVDEILPRLMQQNPPFKLIANISGSTVQEYGEVASIFDNSPVDGIEINISCPNVKEGGAAFGADAQVAAKVVAAVRRSTRKPVITKLSPNVTDITQVARVTIEAGSDALSVINTLMGMAIHLPSRKPILGNIQGGLSGPAIKPVALLKVWQVFREVGPQGVQILGQGGISSTEDALEFMVVGSSAIGVGTALFKNPHIGQEIAEGMANYLKQQGIVNALDLVGSLSI